MSHLEGSEAAILVFAKAPIPGEVKTRLIPALGAEGAARLHRSLVERVLDAAQGVAHARLELWCAPHAGHAFFSDCAARFGAALYPQCGGDLGDRMSHALGEALGRSPRAVLVGSDIPGIDQLYLRAALAALDRAAAVFGPAEDGGYALVGLKRAAPGLFAGVEWGTGQVMAQTRDRLRALGLEWKELEPVRDVDRPEDLERFGE